MVRNKNMQFYLIIAIIINVILIYIKEIKEINFHSKIQFKTNNINQLEYKNYETYRIGNQSNFSNITIMTSMFRLHKSKHPIENYIKWSSTMFESIESPLVAYVDQYWLKIIIKLCRKRNLTALIFVFKNIWNIMKDLEENRKTNYIENYIFNQLAKDPEKKIHSPELYAVWNLKLYLLNKTAHINPFKSHYFIYTDCGAWRARVFPNWPDIRFANEVGKRLRDRILMGQINQPDIKNFFIDRDYLEATFYFGSTKAIQNIAYKYYSIHDKLLEKNLFVGKDQNILNLLAYILHKNKNMIVKIKIENFNCSQFYNEWFFYQYYFAQMNDFICSVDKFSILEFD